MRQIEIYCGLVIIICDIGLHFKQITEWSNKSAEHKTVKLYTAGSYIFCRRVHTWRLL